MYKTRDCKALPCYKKFCAFRHTEDNIQEFFEGIKNKSLEIKELPLISENDEGEDRDEVNICESYESKHSTEDTSLQDNNIKDEGDIGVGLSIVKNNKLTCKQCKENEIKWIMECGAVLCGKCIGNICSICNKRHLTRL